MRTFHIATPLYNFCRITQIATGRNFKIIPDS